MFVLIGCAIWLLLPGWILYLVGQMVMGELDAATGLVVIVLCFFIGFNIYGNPNPVIQGAAAASIVLTVVAWFPARALMERGA
ncbi:hypothetical protein EON81_26755, partial [bacterium]